MDLNTFFTTQIAQTGVTAKAAASGDAAQAVVGGAQNFLDVLIARLGENSLPVPAQAQVQGQTQSKTQTQGQTAAKAQIATPVIATQKEVSEKAANSLLNILADSDEVAEQATKDGENFSLDLLSQIADILALNKQALKEQIDANPELAKSLPIDQQSKPVQEMLKTLFHQDGTTNVSLKEVLARLEKLSAEGSPLVITANLTPEQVTKLQKLVAPASVSMEGAPADDTKAADPTTETKKDEAIAGLMFGLVSLLPPEARPQVIVLPRAIVMADNKVSVDGAVTSKPANDMASTLNKLVAPAAGEQAPFSEAGETPETDGDFKNLLQRMGDAKLKVVGKETNGAENQTKTPGVAPGFSALQGWTLTSPDGLDAAWGAPQGFDSLYAASSIHAGTPSSLTNPILQGQSAGQTMAPSQMVAVALQKNASSGENKNFTLQLDPPELGRVEVRLEFAKDKSMKAHMVVEKPETYAMLQRDGHALERALQTTGIDSGEASISFELASQDHSFGQNGGHDGHNARGGGNEGGGDAGTAIETTMSWHVDPQTGHTRYRLLA